MAQASATLKQWLGQLSVCPRLFALGLGDPHMPNHQAMLCGQHSNHCYTTAWSCALSLRNIMIASVAALSHHTPTSDKVSQSKVCSTYSLDCCATLGHLVRNTWISETFMDICHSWQTKNANILWHNYVTWWRWWRWWRWWCELGDSQQHGDNVHQSWRNKTRMRSSPRVQIGLRFCKPSQHDNLKSCTWMLF